MLRLDGAGTLSLSHTGAALAQRFDVRLSHELICIDAKAKRLRFSNGAVHGSSDLISSVPLPELIPFIDGTPEDVRQAANRLAFTTVLLRSRGVDLARELAECTLSTERTARMRQHSSGNLFSPKHEPLHVRPNELIDGALEDLRQCEFIRSDDEIVLCATPTSSTTPIERRCYERSMAFSMICTLHYLGRYGRWNHAWTDQAFVDGERTAPRGHWALSVVGLNMSQWVRRHYH